MVEVLHCSGFQVCRCLHLPVVKKDHGTGLVLLLTFLGCQGSCGIVPNGPAGLHLRSFQYTSGLELLAHSLDTDLTVATYTVALFFDWNNWKVSE